MEKVSPIFIKAVAPLLTEEIRVNRPDWTLAATGEGVGQGRRTFFTHDNSEPLNFVFLKKFAAGLREPRTLPFSNHHCAAIVFILAGATCAECECHSQAGGDFLIAFCRMIPVVAQKIRVVTKRPALRRRERMAAAGWQDAIGKNPRRMCITYTCRPSGSGKMPFDAEKAIVPARHGIILSLDTVKPKLTNQKT
jgi:hypothetical protein